MPATTKPIANTFQLCLIITEKCNLSCSYCFCDKSHIQSMTYDTACAEIDRTFVDYPKITDLIHILLMGGEPFLEFDLIKKLVVYVKSAYSNRKVKFKAITNGTLVHGQIQEWLLENKDIFRVELSIDGQETDHNKFRSGSFGEIDFPFFREKLSRPTVSMVIIPDTLNHFSGNIIYLADAGFNIKCVIADGIDWTSDENIEILARQLMMLIEYYLANPDKYPFNMMSLATYCIGSDFHLPKCRPGINSKAIDADGTSLACHRSSDYFNTGQWKIPEKDIDLKGIEYLNKACDSCCVKEICNTCPASIASIRNDQNQSEMSCRLSKTLFYANAYFHFRLLTESPEHIFFRNRDMQQKMAMLNGSRHILNNLNPEVPF